MPKAARAERPRHDPLHKELSEGNGILRNKGGAAKSKGTSKGSNGEEEEEGFIDSKTSRKILQLAQRQQEELDEEDGVKRDDFADFEDDDDDELAWEDEDEEDEDGEEYEMFNQDIEEYEMDPEEEDLFRKYMPGYGEGEEDGEPLTLAEKIMEKVREKEQAESMMKNPSQPPAEGGVMLPPKVIEVYTRVGELLSRYRSGKLPKAFKIIPSLKNWQDVLYVTEPDAWSTQAVYEATKLFVSNLKANQAQYYIQDVLLERFRDDVRSNGTLNYHLYRSLKKALYKPAAFFKGFLFPLCESGTCTLKEAVIVGSVLTKVSVPSLHSAAALLKLSDMSYSGPNSLFMKILLNKKYALPYKVIDGVVFHFMRFRQNTEKLPVIWHQSFLVFAQRYKNDITEDQKDSLIEVLRNQTHEKITPEIRRELLSGKPRDTVMDIDE